MLCNGIYHYLHPSKVVQRYSHTIDMDRDGLSNGARSSWTYGSHAARKRDNWFPVCLYIKLNTCIDVKAYPAGTKHLYNIYTTSAQRLPTWVQHCILYKCFVFAGYVLPSHWVYWTWCVYVYDLCPHMCTNRSHIFTWEAYFVLGCFILVVIFKYFW